MYLEHSCRYYELDAPVISDAAFDALCAALLEQWDEVTHRYKHLADMSALRAGTGFQMSHRFPQAIVNLVRSYPDVPLYKVFDPMVFADEYEEKAYGAICVFKYGSYGGNVNKDDVKRVGNFLRGRPLAPPRPVLQLPPQLPKLSLPTLPKLSLPPK